MAAKTKHTRLALAPTLIIFLMGALSGTVLGAAWPQAQNQSLGHHSLTQATHTHMPFEVNPALPIPLVELTIHPDAKSGLNLEIGTENFTFDPAQASQEHQDNHGHAHVFVDDIKVARVYGNWFHLEGLEPGEHLVEVILTTNDHFDYTYQDQTIMASETIVVPE